MEQLIPVINRLHDAFSSVEGGQVPLDLPQIVVVGSQSTGKSSVLESLVGKDFLPRGAGIVTRRPLILQLIHTAKKQQKKENKGEKEKDGHGDLEFVDWGEDLEWGEFLHLPGEKFYDFKEIREEIQRETDKMTGKNKGISAVPINLKVYSPHVVNLTLVDLPGITKVPVGDQPKDIEQQIRRMIYSYIEKPNSIILAVTSANTDLSTSDSLEIARTVDPNGDRTVGVITKLDIMDKGTDALEMLQNKVIPLKLGFIGVVCRSQKDIIENKPIAEAIKKEKDYFASSPVYNVVASRCGVKFLGDRCAQILMNHIRNCLPDLKMKINQMVLETSNEMKTYGDNQLNISPGALLLQVINSFAATYAEMIDGKVSDELSVESLYGGARIAYIFNEVYSKHLHQLEPTDGLSKKDIKTAMHNATGPKAALFVPESAFELLVKRQLVRIREPAVQCVDLVYDELERIVHTIVSPELQRFASLKEELTEAAVNLVRNCRVPTKEMITNVLNMEFGYINLRHPDFKVDAIIHSVMQRRQQHQMQPKQAEVNPLFDQHKQATAPPLPSKENIKQPAATTAPRDPKQPVPTQTPQVPSQQQQQNMGANADKNSFFGMFFGQGGMPPKREPESRSYSSSYPSQARVVKLDSVPQTLQVNAIPQEKEFEIDLLEALLDAYFNIVRKNMMDSVPKAIMYFLVSKSKSEMQNELVQQLYKEASFERLLAESPDIVSRRQSCKQRLELLQKAQSILNEVRDYRISHH